MTKDTDSPLDPEVLLQSIEPGSLIPVSIIDPFDQDKSGLFLLNFSKYIKVDIWGDYGDKELAQAEKLRSFAAHVVALANAMEELGHHLKSYPDRDEFEFGDHEQSLEQIGEEMNTTLESGYRKLQALLADLAEAAVGDYMD